MGKEHREGQEAKDRVYLQPDTAHTPAQLPSYSSEPNKANKKDYRHPGRSILSHSDSGRCCALQATGRLAPNLPKYPQKPWPRCHIHLKAMLLRIYCHLALLKITLAVLWVGHTRWVTSFCSTLDPWSATEMHEALFVPAHTRAERWGLASLGTAPFPACTQAGGDSPPPAPSPASLSHSQPGANRGCGAAAAPAALRPSPPSAEGTRGLRVAAELRGHLPAAGTEKPSAGGHRPGSGLRLPRHKEAWESER